MKILRTLCCSWLLAAAMNAAAQSETKSDSVIAVERAMLFADSLVKASFYQNWNAYLSLSTPSAIKYYGGKEGFKDHVITHYFHDESSLEEKPETITMISMMYDGLEEWQCVIEKIRHTFLVNRKVKIHTYLLGRSLDNGLSWTFVDVGHNSVANVIYIFPEIFGNLAIPEVRIVYEEDVTAQQEPPMQDSTTTSSGTGTFTSKIIVIEKKKATPKKKK